MYQIHHRIQRLRLEIYKQLPCLGDRTSTRCREFCWHHRKAQTLTHRLRPQAIRFKQETSLRVDVLQTSACHETCHIRRNSRYVVRATSLVRTHCALASPVCFATNLVKLPIASYNIMLYSLHTIGSGSGKVPLPRHILRGGH